MSAVLGFVLLSETAFENFKRKYKQVKAAISQCRKMASLCVSEDFKPFSVTQDF